jgi:uncharacterized protein YdaU (DUF1376 family)
MAEHPFMPVRTAALLADTTWMSAEEFGAYCRILFTMWANGGRLTDDERDLARITGCGLKRWRKIGPRIMRLLIAAGGQLSQKRLTDTWLNVQERRVKRSRAALAGYATSRNFNGLDRPDALQMQGNQNQNQIRDSFFGSAKQAHLPYRPHEVKPRGNR